MLKRLFASNKRPYFRYKGPWEKRVFDLSGCKLEITMPPHDFEFPEEDRGARFNVFDDEIYNYDTDTTKKWGATYEGVSRIFTRKWESYGPIWRSQPLGFMQSTLVVCDTSRMKASLNCFNPEHMERLIRHLIYYNDGPGFSSGREAKSPVDWQVKTLDKHDFVYYESWPQKPSWSEKERPHLASIFTLCLVAPIFEDKYLYFSFSSVGSIPAEPSVSLMRDRISRIIASIKLELSEHSLEQKNSAKTKFPSAKYSSQRAPEAWKYYESFREGDIFSGEDEIVLEGECSPPPPLG